MSSLRAGIRAGVPYAIAGGVFSFTFGVTARPLIGALAAIVMSIVCFAGASQFAALAVLAAGGDAATAVIIGALVNLRFVPMGISIAPWMSGGPVWRAVRSQAIADPSWVMARRSDGRYDVDFMTGSTVAQYVTWVSGTAIGVAVGPLLGDTNRFGLDVVFPAFMLGLLASELTNGRARTAAALGAVISLALTPVLPAGLPIAAATVATVIGLRRVSSTAVITIVGLGIATFWTRALGPVFFGGRDLPGVLARMVPLLAPALVAALIAVDTFGGSGKSLTIDPRAAGLAVAALAFYRRAPVLVAVFGAIATTALVRLLT